MRLYGTLAILLMLAGCGLFVWGVYLLLGAGFASMVAGAFCIAVAGVVIRGLKLG